VLKTDVPEVLDSRLTLAEKIEEYTLRLGQAPTYTLGVMVQILTVGKIRLEFSEYDERLELVRKSDLMTRVEAVELVEEFLANIGNQQSRVDHITQRIIVQPPRKPVG